MAHLSQSELRDPSPSPSLQETDAESTPTSSPSEVWAKLLAKVQPISSFVWVDKVTLGVLDLKAGLCTIRPRPGERDIHRVVGQRQCERLAGELSKLLARPIRIQLDAPDPPSQRQADTPGKPSSNATERQKAVGLSLVRDVLDVFPDAVLMDTRREAEPPQPSEDES